MKDEIKKRSSKKGVEKIKTFEDHTGMTLYILRAKPMTFKQILSEFMKMEFNFSFSYRHFFETRMRKRSKNGRKK